MVFLRTVSLKCREEALLSKYGLSLSVENGTMAIQIVMRAGVHRAAMFRINLKFLKTGSVENRPKPGRLKSTTAV